MVTGDLTAYGTESIHDYADRILDGSPVGMTLWNV